VLRIGMSTAMSTAVEWIATKSFSMPVIDSAVVSFEGVWFRVGECGYGGFGREFVSGLAPLFNVRGLEGNIISNGHYSGICWGAVGFRKSSLLFCSLSWLRYAVESLNYCIHNSGIGFRSYVSQRKQSSRIR